MERNETKRNYFVSENSKNPYILLKQDTKWNGTKRNGTVSFLVLVICKGFYYFQKRNNSVSFRFVPFRFVSISFYFISFLVLESPVFLRIKQF